MLFLPHFILLSQIYYCSIKHTSDLRTQCSNVKIPAEFRLCGLGEKYAHFKVTWKLKGLMISTCGDFLSKILKHSLIFTKFPNAHEKNIVLSHGKYPQMLSKQKRPFGSPLKSHTPTGAPALRLHRASGCSWCVPPFWGGRHLLFGQHCGKHSFCLTPAFNLCCQRHTKCFKLLIHYFARCFNYASVDLCILF